MLVPAGCDDDGVVETPRTPTLGPLGTAALFLLFKEDNLG